MTLARANSGGWASNDELTSAQINTIDVNVSNAVDKTSAGDTVAGAIALSGAGRILPGQQTGANADTTYTVGTAPEIRVTSAVTSDRIYTLSATGVSTNDRILIWCDATATNNITVKDQAAATLIVLGPGTTGQAMWAEFIYSSGWKLHSANTVKSHTTTFTASGSWVCPAGVTEVILYGVGGGGGGGSSTAAAGGGGGGGGAYASVVRVTVVPATTYTVTIGAGGVGGGGGTSGLDGGDTTFGSLARFMGAQGGIANDVGTPYGGGPIRGMAYATTMATHPGQGGQGDQANNNGFIHATGPATGGAGTGVDGGAGGGNSGFPGGQGGAGSATANGAAGVLGGGGGGGSDGDGGDGGDGALTVTWTR